MMEDLVARFEREVDLCAWGQKPPLSLDDRRLAMECVLVTLLRNECERQWYGGQRSLLEVANEVRQLPTFVNVKDSRVEGLLLRFVYDEQLLQRSKAFFSKTWDKLDRDALNIAIMGKAPELWGLSLILRLHLPNDLVDELKAYIAPISKNVQFTQTVHLTVTNLVVGIAQQCDADVVCAMANKRIARELKTNSTMIALVRSLTRNLSVEPNLFVNPDGALALNAAGDSPQRIHDLRLLLRSTVLPDLHTSHERVGQGVWSHLVWARIVKPLSRAKLKAMRQQPDRSSNSPITLQGTELALMVFQGKAMICEEDQLDILRV